MLQVFLTDRNDAHVVHMSEEKEDGDDLLQIFQLVGVSQHMVTYGAKYIPTKMGGGGGFESTSIRSSKKYPDHTVGFKTRPKL